MKRASFILFSYLILACTDNNIPIDCSKSDLALTLISVTNATGCVFRDGEIKIENFEVFGFYFLGSVGLSGLNVGRLRNESAMTVFVGFLDGEIEISNPRIFVINRVGF